MLLFWGLIFVGSLVLLVKGADWFIENSEKIGLAFKISPFIIGVTIVAIGTSFPELASSLAAVFKDTTEIVAANVIGSNIANILLIIGLSAIAAKKLAVRRSLIDIDLPLLASTAVLFGFIFWDKKIVWQEGILLLFAFFVYLFYTFTQREEIETKKPLPEEMIPEEIFEILPSRIERRKVKEPSKKLSFRTFFFLILGIIFLCIGANYLVDSILELSQILKIGVSVIAILGVAVGTSLPELIVSLKAALMKKYEIALGNIFGSNVLNLLLIMGLPALLKTLIVDEITFKIGFPFMAVATFLLVISGITRRISTWEGSMFLLIYLLFIIKLFGIF